jgi:hypothetical protein
VSILKDHKRFTSFRNLVLVADRLDKDGQWSFEIVADRQAQGSAPTAGCCHVGRANECPQLGVSCQFACRARVADRERPQLGGVQMDGFRAQEVESCRCLYEGDPRLHTLSHRRQHLAIIVCQGQIAQGMLVIDPQRRLV